MEFQSLIKELENTSLFNAWRVRVPDAFLAHIFVLLDETNRGTYHVGYYDPNNERMTTFVVGKGTVDIIEDQEVAKAAGAHLQPLDITLVNDTEKKVLQEAEKIRKEHYAKALVFKSFYIIQAIDDQQVYNITFMTQDFKTINIKLDMQRELISHDCKALADFISKQPA